MIGFLIALLSGALMSVQGVFKYTGDENGRNVGVERMGAVERFYGLRCSVAVYRKRQYRSDRKSGAEIYAAWRCDRRRDHLDCN